MTNIQYRTAKKYKKLIAHCQEAVDYTKNGFFQQSWIKYIKFKDREGSFDIDVDFQKEIAELLNQFYIGKLKTLKSEFEKL